MIDHLLITRFNLRIPGWRLDKAGREVRTPQWERKRIALFERYCLPSVMHQGERRFRWLLLLDDQSGEELRRRVGMWQERMDNLHAVFLPVASHRQIAAAVRERVAPGSDLVLTTRLDNDDALHENALAQIRQHARYGRREFLNLRLGFTTDGQRARVVSHKYSPFTTLAEPAGDGELRTVHCGLPHGRVRKLAPVRQIAHEPLWLRVVHGGNMENRGRSDRRERGRGVRGLQVRVRRFGRRVRRRFWPAEYRRAYTLEEVAPAFHVGEFTS